MIDVLREHRWLRAAAVAIGGLLLLEILWRPPARLVLHGMAVGSLYGLLAMGVVLVYRSHRIVNFAAGSMGAVPAVLALTLMTTHGLSWYLAFPLALAGGALTGGATHATVVRRFAQAPRLLLTVVTVGLAQLFVFLAFRIPGWLGTSVLPIEIRTPFSGVYLCREDSALGPVSRACHRLLGADDLDLDLVLTLVVVGAISAGLSLFFRRTRIGIALRASAENKDRAALLGVPVDRVSTVAWAIAGILAATTIFLRAPLVGLPLGGLAGPSIILFALTAAMIARMESMPVALAAGMAIGVIDQSAVFASGRAAVATATMLPIVLAALALQRGRRARTPEASSWQSVGALRRRVPGFERLPGIGPATIVGGAAAALALPGLVGDANIGFLTLVVITAIIGVSLVVLTGWAGQVSLGQYGFVGVGALVAGAMAGNHGADLFATLAVGAFAGAALAVIVGLPAARLPGLFQAVATLAFGAVVELYVLNPDFFIGRALLPRDANRILRPMLWRRVDLSGDRAFYVLCLVVLAVVLASAWSFRRFRSGRVLVAVRDNPAAAAAYGLHPGRVRLAAFALSGCFAGTAGVLLAYQQGAVDSATYGAHESIAVFAMTVVGGIGSVSGAVLAAVVFEGVKLLERTSATFEHVSLLATGPGLVVVLLLLPGGLVDALRAVRDRFLLMLVPVPAPVARPSRGAAASDLVHPAHPVVLRCERVEVSYGGVKILFGIDLEVREGEIVALLGTNGAGKSTLLRAVSGLAEPCGGRITLDGEDVTAVGPSAMAAMGVVQVPGGKSVFPSLTVAEHFDVATWLSRDVADESVDGAVDAFPVLRERWDHRAGDLSGGQQQMLGLAMALVTQPRLLVIDELSLGLDAATVARLLDVVRRVNGQGTAILLVEQSVDVAAEIADRAYFLEKGEVRFSGPPRELLARDDIVRSVFLSAEVAERGPKRKRVARAAAGSPILEVRGLRKRFGGVVAVDGVDLELSPDRIVGLMGSNGAGKTTIFDLISGHQTPDEGTILLDGVDVTGWGPHRRSLAGLGRSFQDSRIFPALTVADNIAVGFDRHAPCRDHLAAATGLPAVHRSEEEVGRTVDALVERFGLGAYRDVPAGELSTGTRHLVDLAMALAHRPAVLLLDEPSSGVAQKETEAMGPLLRRVQRAAGCAMLVIEHDMGLLAQVADEIIVLEQGRVVARGAPGRVLRSRGVRASRLGRPRPSAGGGRSEAVLAAGV